MTAKEKAKRLSNWIEARTGIAIEIADAARLRRCEMTLHRWAEGECGCSNAWASTAIERDEETGKPCRATYWHDGITKKTITPIPDWERGALKTVASICGKYGLHFYHQGDPRGCALYVYHEPLTDTNYPNGVACSGE